MKFTRRGWGVAVFIGSVFLGVAAEPPAPKLVGIVRVENRKSALLELKEQTPWGTMETRKPILSEGDCDGAFGVTAIDEKEATVSMTHGRETLTVSLGQGPEEALANRTLHFKAASFDQVLDIYQNLIRRTIISRVRFGREITLKSTAGLSAQKAAALLSQAFLEKGIAVKLSGENFAFLVDADHLDQLAGLSEPPLPVSRLRLLQGDVLSKVGLGKFAPKVFPPGMMKFQDTDILQVLEIYQDLTGRTVLRPQQLPPGKISVRSETALTRKQAVWLLDALLFVQAGIAMSPETEKFVFAVPKERKGGLPKFSSDGSAAKAAQIFSAGAIKFQDAPIRQMIELYAQLSGREALPLEHFPQINFSLRNQQPLSGAETIFALEAVAALNNARLESVGDTKVQIVPSALKKISPR